MVNLAKHAANASIVFEFNDVIKLSETESIECALLVNGGADAAASLLYLNCCHNAYPLNTLSMDTPRC